MTATAAATTSNAESKVNPMNEPIGNKVAQPAEKAADIGTKGEAGRGSTEHCQNSSRATCATTKGVSENATPFQCSTFGSGGGAGVPTPVSLRHDAVVRGQFNGRGHHPAATIANAASAAAGVASKDAARSVFIGSEGDTGSKAQVVVEAEGCGVLFSPLHDPEVTHPQRATD